MPEGAQSSKTGFSSGFKGKVKKFGQSLGVGESRSRSQSPSASVSSVPSTEKTEPLPAARARASTPPIVINTLRTRSQPDASTRDLWRAAFETLTPEDKRALATSNGDADHAKPPASLVEDVVRLTTEKCAQYEAGGWHIERKGHEDINVRDKAKSLLLSVLTFKDLIDAGLKFDVSGYGALAWSVVSFGLNVS